MRRKHNRVRWLSSRLAMVAVYGRQTEHACTHTFGIYFYLYVLQYFMCCATEEATRWAVRTVGQHSARLQMHSIAYKRSIECGVCMEINVNNNIGINSPRETGRTICALWSTVIAKNEHANILGTFAGKRLHRIIQSTKHSSVFRNSFCVHRRLCGIRSTKLSWPPLRLMTA